MHNHLTKKRLTRNEKPNRALLFLLLTIFLLSSCPVKKGIQVLLHGNYSVENSILNPNKTVSLNKTAAIADFQICSASQSLLDEIDLRSIQSSQPVLPLNLLVVCFLSALSFALLAFHQRIPSSYFSKTTFPQANTPLYIRNRLLLI
jgi:hypothetical protein